MPKKPLPRKTTTPKAVKSPSPQADNAGGPVLGGVGWVELRRLIRLVQRSGIGELEVRTGDRSVRISATSGVVTTVTPALAAPAPARPTAAPAQGAAPETPSNDRTVAITSPMVGTYYRAPAPDADPYVETGDRIEVGQTVCIVEAMKLMNEIESDVKGRIVEILVQNAQPVEFGQKLFLVEPD